MDTAVEPISQPTAPVIAPDPSVDTTSALNPGALSDPNVLQPTSSGPVTPAPGAASGGAKQPGLWQQVLQGALAGLAGAAGQKHFGGGLAAGAENALRQQRIGVENQQRQQQLRFESARAAAEMIDAATRARQEDMASKLTQARIDELNANTKAYLQDHNI